MLDPQTIRIENGNTQDSGFGVIDDNIKDQMISPIKKMNESGISFNLDED